MEDEVLGAEGEGVLDFAAEGGGGAGADALGLAAEVDEVAGVDARPGRCRAARGASRILAASAGLTAAGLHMRGLEEKIWKVLAPASTARSTAVQQPPAVPTCTPMRFLLI